jgi:hypothetical protein
VSPLLLEMVQWSELRKSPHGTAAAPDLLMLLRLNKAQLKTAATQEEVVSQVGRAWPACSAATCEEFAMTHVIFSHHGNTCVLQQSL